MTVPFVPLAFGVAASLTTIAGGVLAFRLAHRMTAILAIAAGVVLGVAFFDLLPEALEFGERSYTHRSTIALAALGFTGYLLLSRLLATAEKRSRWQAHLGPASLTLHSFLDGLLMGMAFQIAPEIGWAVALIGAWLPNVQVRVGHVAEFLPATEEEWVEFLELRDLCSGTSVIVVELFDFSTVGEVP